VIVSPFQKPFRGTRINPVHPLARGLVEAWMFNEQTGALIFDAAGGRSATIGSSMTWQAGGLQAGGTYDDANNRITGPSHNPAQWPGISVFFAGRLVNPPSGAYPAISYCGPHGESYGNWMLAYEAGGAPVWKPGNNSSALYLTMDISGERTLCGTWARQGMARLYADGREIASGVKSNDWPGYSQPHLINGYYRDGVHRSSAHLYQCLYVYNRELSSLEVQTLNANPYCMFRQPTDIGAFGYVQGGGGYVDLAGSINTPSQLTASLKRYIGMAGVANFTFSAENALKATRKVQGTLETSGSLDGTTKVTRSISGLISVKANMSLAIGFMVNLSGIIEAGGNVAGQIKIVKDISGNVSSTSSLAGVVKPFRGMDGNILIPSSLNGTAKTTRNLIGASETVSDLAASLKPIRGISGVIDSRAEVAGFTSIFKTIIGAIASKANLSAALELSGTIEFSGSISTKGEMASNLRLNLSLSGEITTAPSLKGNIRTFKTLSGALETVASIVGDAMRIRGFSGDIASATSIEGYLVRDMVLSGAITSSIDVNGKVKIILSFSGSMDSLASLIASLSTFIPSTLGNPIDVSIVSVSTQRELYSITIKRTLTEV